MYIYKILICVRLSIYPYNKLDNNMYYWINYQHNILSHEICQ